MIVVLTLISCSCNLLRAVFLFIALLFYIYIYTSSIWTGNIIKKEYSCLIIEYN